MDFEASSLSVHSYPIEVAWNDAQGTIHSYLINPAHVPDWTEWSAQSERIHGIPRATLTAQGLPPEEVCAKVQAITAMVVYSDAARFDLQWLECLFDACAARSSIPFYMDEMDHLLWDILGKPDSKPSELQRLIESLKEQARSQAPGRHRAAWDVQYLMQLYRLAVGAAAG